MVAAELVTVGFTFAYSLLLEDTVQWNVVQEPTLQEGGYTLEYQQADYENDVIDRSVYRWPNGVTTVFYNGLTTVQQKALILDGMNGLQ